MGSTVHLWTAFVGLVTFQHFLRLLSAAFTELLTPDVSIFGASRSIKGAFQGVTPSFHLSNYQFTELIETALCATFSAANKSHGYSASTSES